MSVRIWASTKHWILPFTQSTAPGSAIKIDYDGYGGYNRQSGKDYDISFKKGTMLINSFSGREFYMLHEDRASNDIQINLYQDNDNASKFYLDFWSDNTSRTAIFFLLKIYDISTLWCNNTLKLTELVQSDNQPENATKVNFTNI